MFVAVVYSALIIATWFLQVGSRRRYSTLAHAAVAKQLSGGGEYLVWSDMRGMVKSLKWEHHMWFALHHARRWRVGKPAGKARMQVKGALANSSSHSWLQT